MIAPANSGVDDSDAGARTSGTAGLALDRTGETTVEAVEAREASLAAARTAAGDGTCAKGAGASTCAAFSARTF
jgi:transposase